MAQLLATYMFVDSIAYKVRDGRRLRRIFVALENVGRHPDAVAVVIADLGAAIGVEVANWLS